MLFSQSQGEKKKWLFGVHGKELYALACGLQVEVLGVACGVSPGQWRGVGVSALRRWGVVWKKGLGQRMPAARTTQPGNRPTRHGEIQGHEGLPPRQRTRAKLRRGTGRQPELHRLNATDRVEPCNPALPTLPPEANRTANQAREPPTQGKELTPQASGPTDLYVLSHA